MDLDSIKKLPYSLLINSLPKIVSSFSTSTHISKNFNRGWNRMHWRRIVKTVSMPKEIELYIINEIKDIDKYFESRINIVRLIKTTWYISFKPFEDAIIVLLSDVMKSSKKVKGNALIFIDNLMRKNGRPFDVFFVNDLIWLLGTYFNSIIDKSKIITYRNKNMESYYPKSDIFPFKDILKDINEIEFCWTKYNNILENISDCHSNGNHCIIYITNMLMKYDFEYFYSKYNQFNLKNHKKRGTQSIIIWELKPSIAINQK